MVTMSRATEDYLKAIYNLAHRGEAVTTGQLAHELGVSSPSASAMIKRLEDGDLLSRPDSRSLRLTDSGERAALRVVRRHRLLETFLHRMLDVPWDEVHAEAELLEHALSDRLEERIDAALGHPTHDPHGDPIPPRHGPHDEQWGAALATIPPGVRFRVQRISDRDSAALRYLGELGLLPGVVIDVEEQDPFGGPRWIRVEGQRRSLGAPLTQLVHGHVLDGNDTDTSTYDRTRTGHDVGETP
jgi:DtxR family transcriptional regulator, Mn-dependent transcriptional regulator